MVQMGDLSRKGDILMASLRPITLALLALWAMSCALFEPKVPLFDTVAEQYRYADDLVILTDPIPLDQRGTNVLDPNSMYSQYRTRDYHRFIEAFEAVVDNFPKDEVYTPQAKLRLAEYHFQLREHASSIMIYRALLEEYPDDDLIQAGSLYGLGNVYMMRQQFSEAATQYGALLQRFPNSLNPRIVELQQRALERLSRIRYRTS